jgi:hypothetical protein
LSARGKEPIGKLDGLLIDVAARQVHYLVVEAVPGGRRQLLPLDATCLDMHGPMLARVGSDPHPWDSFDPSRFPPYDDTAVLSLLFG